jgi:hypothetical protein
MVLGFLALAVVGALLDGILGARRLTGEQDDWYQSTICVVQPSMSGTIVPELSR